MSSWENLHAIDPVRAQAIHKNDTYRIERALDRWSQTGQLPSQQGALYKPPFEYTILYVTRSRSELYERINQRVLAMLNDGLLAEIAPLCNTPWEPFLKNKKIIGYSDFLDDTLNMNEKVAQMQQRTRNYAKRQETFWRSLKQRLLRLDEGARILEFNLTSDNLDLYLKQVANHLNF